VLVTAGGTREPIDAVRYIGNRSSGRMGFALAGAAAQLGAEVAVVAANVSLPAPPGVRVVPVSTAAELADVCRREFDACDVLLMTAAVADFRPRHPAGDKLKKDAGAPTIELERTEDVLSDLAGHRRPGGTQILVGFAAEHGAGALRYGRDKLERKGLDAVVVNDISKPGIGFDATENEVTILTADGGASDVPRAAKERVAAVVLQEVQRLRAGKEHPNRTSRADPRSAARV
jgi:phosphopantothenoylcysteine decarboxylase/phosphopantothenate--cysteine ligase